MKWKKGVGVLLLFLILIFTPKKTVAAGNVHALVVSGRSLCKVNAEKMYTSLCANKLAYYKTSSQNIKSFYYDAGGKTYTTKDKACQQIKGAFSSSTAKDLNIFYYTGHGASNGLPFHMKKKETLEGISYENLAAELAKYKGTYVVILDSCFAQAFYKNGVLSLDAKNRRRFICLSATDWQSPSYVFPGLGDLFTNRLLAGIGYSLTAGIPGSNNKYQTLDADSNRDGEVSVWELYHYTYGKSAMLCTPHCNGEAGSGIGIFQFAYTKQTASAVTMSVGTSKTLKANLYRNGDRARTVKWKSSDTSIATVSSAGKVTAKKSGSVNITSYLADSFGEMYQGSESVCKITVTPSIKLNKSSLTLYKETTGQLKATVKGSSKKPSWKSSDKSVATVSSKGKINAKKAGTVTITAAVSGVKASCTVTVKNPTIKLDVSSLTLEKGKTRTLKATVKGKSKKVTWSSNNKSVATVNKSGKITAKKQGTAVITAKANGVSAKCTVTVKDVDYKALYYQFLKKAETSFSYKRGNRTFTAKAKSFYLQHLNTDSIPELIISAYTSCPMGPEDFWVFTIKDNKVVYCGSVSQKGGVFEIGYSKKHKALYNTWWSNGNGGAGSELWRVKGTKLMEYKCAYSYYEGSKRIYKTGTKMETAKKVSASVSRAFNKTYFENITYDRRLLNTEAVRRQKFK